MIYVILAFTSGGPRRLGEGGAGLRPGRLRPEALPRRRRGAPRGGAAAQRRGRTKRV